MEAALLPLRTPKFLLLLTFGHGPSSHTDYINLEHGSSDLALLRIWTEEDGEQLRTLKGDVKSKYSYRAVAKKLDRSVPDITQRWKTLEGIRKSAK